MLRRRLPLASLTSLWFRCQMHLSSWFFVLFAMLLEFDVSSFSGDSSFKKNNNRKRKEYTHSWDEGKSSNNICRKSANCSSTDKQTTRQQWVHLFLNRNAVLLLFVDINSLETKSDLNFMLFVFSYLNQKHSLDDLLIFVVLWSNIVSLRCHCGSFNTTLSLKEKTDENCTRSAEMKLTFCLWYLFDPNFPFKKRSQPWSLKQKRRRRPTLLFERRRQKW